LWVTDANLLTDYVYSMWDAQGVILEENYKDLQAHFQGKIKQFGGIKIRKSTGLFLASSDQRLIESVSNLKA